MIKDEYKNLSDDEFVDLTEGIDKVLLNLFEINKLGQIRRKSDKRILLVTPRPERDYPTIRLRLNNKRYTYRIHLLLAKTFLIKDPNTDEVDHINRNTGDYSLANLRWVSKSENKKNRVFNENSYKYFKIWVGFDSSLYNKTSTKPILESTINKEMLKQFNNCWKTKTSFKNVYWKPFLIRSKDLFDRFDFPTDWKLIPDSNNSYCSSNGLILLTGKTSADLITEGYLNWAGYRLVNIRKKLYRVHRLVYSLFGETDLSDVDIIDHVDTNRSNNNIKNLRKVSNMAENLNNPLTKLKTSKRVVKCDLEGNELKEYDSCVEAYKDLGVSIHSSSITSCCRGKMKTYKGFIWKYKD